jgi:hypothetical protein
VKPALRNRNETSVKSSTSRLFSQNLYRPNHFGWPGAQSPAEAENRIDGRHSQTSFNQGNVSPFKPGYFRQLFLGDASIPPESGERLADDASHFLRFIRQIQADSVSGTAAHFLAL